MKMKTVFGIAMMLLLSGRTMAGGYVTNTNHNAAFLRNPAQDGKIDINALYSNPAGIGFLDNGWHLSFNVQSAYQNRDVTSNFGTSLGPLYSQGAYSLGKVNGTANAVGEKEFKGRAKAPVIPALDVAYVQDKWSAMFHFALGGGGGKCDFEDGLGSFESLVAMMPLAINAGASAAAGGAPVTIVDGYSMDSWMKGRQYYFGFQFQGGYKVLDNLNVSAGVRGVYASCAYEGYVGNIKMHTVAAPSPVSSAIMAAKSIPANVYLPGGALLGTSAALAADRELDVTQSGFGVTPIVGVDWKINNNWNVAAKYEFGTRLRLKNSTSVNTTGLASYDDGEEQAADIPALLTVGAQYSPSKAVRLNVGGHLYFDKQAKQEGNRQEKLDGQTWELLAGAEWDINDWATVSAGWQTTNYGLGENSQYISDMSFVTNSNSFGLGARFKVAKNVAIDVAYFKTLYQHYRVDYADYNNIGARFGALVGNPSMKVAGYNNYYRTNDVFGLGVNITL